MDEPPIPPPAQRVAVFMKRLYAAPNAASKPEAYGQVCDILNAVEDELTGIPFNPATWRTDHRIYPPQSDRMFSDPDRPGVTGYFTRKQIILIGENGAIEIRRRETDKVVFSKPGADGRTL